MEVTGNALTGPELDAFLDRLEADLEESGSGKAANLLARLRANALRATTIEAVDRLHTLWVRAGDTSMAYAVVDNDGGAIVAASAQAQRADMEMRLALFRLQLAHFQGDAEKALHALSQMHGIASAPQGFNAEGYNQLHILDRLEQWLSDIALSSIELRHAVRRATASRTELRAWDEADRQRRRAMVLSRSQEEQQAREAAKAAIFALHSAQPGQNIDENDWLWLGDSLVDIVPEQLAQFSEPVLALTRTWSLPQQRETAVRLARLAARATYAKGDLVGALVACVDARYSLSSDGSDDFVTYELPWLFEAGQIENAGRRAFFHIYQLETNMWPGVPQWVSQRLADASDDAVWWPLCVMRACHTPETLQSFVAALPPELSKLSPAHAVLFDGPAQELDVVAVFDAARRMAEQRAPGHPWIERLAVVRDGDANIIGGEEAVARLQAAATSGAMQDNRTALSLLLAQVRAHGVVKALKASPPVLPSGLWAYNFGVDVSDVLDDVIGVLPAEQQDEANARLAQLQQAVYEQGRICLEHYFETGSGHPYDACAHLYSMLCNNLAILYRYDKNDRYEEAIALHRRGIAASPFAEHYDGIMRARICQGDEAGIVDAAEQLWHFAAEYGYSRHDPNGYIGYVTKALYDLDRDQEIPIWLERLVGWQHSEGMEDRNLPTEALSMRLRVGMYMSFAYPAEVSALWESVEPQVRINNDLQMLIRAADLLYSIKRYAEAASMYGRALAHNPLRNEAENDNTAWIAERLTRCAEAMNPPGSSAKSWWQFWK